MERIRVVGLGDSAVDFDAKTITITARTDSGPLVIELQPNAAVSLLALVASVPAPQGMRLTRLPAIPATGLHPIYEAGYAGVLVDLGKSFGLPVVFPHDALPELRRIVDQLEFFASRTAGSA